VLHEEEIGNIKTAAVFGYITEDERKKIKNDDLQITNMPIQKFFIYLTEGRNGGRKNE
jgi:ABC-2 type transport system ATP-binding protein